MTARLLPLNPAPSEDPAVAGGAPAAAGMGGARTEWAEPGRAEPGRAEAAPEGATGAVETPARGWRAAEDGRLAAALVASGAVPAHLMVHALAHRQAQGGNLIDVLSGHCLVESATLYAALGRHFGAVVVDPLRAPPDPTLLRRFGAARALRLGLLPWRRAGRRTVVLAARPADLGAARAALEESFGPVQLALAPAAAIEAAILAAAGPALAAKAESTVPAPLSSRDLGRCRTRAGLVALAAGGLLALWVAPQAVAALLCLMAVIAMLASMALKAAALVATLRAGQAPPVPRADTPLPTVSILVALYRKANIAARLVRRLERLDYPRDRLEVLVAVEADDPVTRGALARSRLPPWMRVVVVPGGGLRTKPRALNHAFSLSRGEIVGIYDAEDAPAPDQLRRVAAAFAAAPPRVACLQGCLDFYNPRDNWMARMFTLEYAAWFRVMLPGIARMGLAVPLGGTTLFFRRRALEDLGAWDAWNVTEDADLGIRLARAGLRTELIDSVTLEEANCRPWPWVRQRSRWIKGYMMTWAVHMRRPGRLWRELGPRAFAGFQVMFLGSFVQALLAPFLWSFWLMLLGAPHPAAGLPAGLLLGLLALFLLAEAAGFAVGWIALRRRGGGLSPLWILAHHAYFPLATAAALKALWELVVRPFYWDKTAHGLTRATPRPPAAERAGRFLRHLTDAGLARAAADPRSGTPGPSGPPLAARMAATAGEDPARAALPGRGPAPTPGQCADQADRNDRADPASGARPEAGSAPALFRPAAPVPANAAARSPDGIAGGGAGGGAAGVAAGVAD